MVLGVRQRRCDCGEILPPWDVRHPYTFSRTIVRGARPATTRPRIRFQNGQNVPNGSRVVSFSAKAAITPGEREVLAWKGGPCEVDGCRRQIGQREAATSPTLMSPSPQLARRSKPLPIEVIREQAAPLLPKPRARHAAASEKLDESELGHARDRFSAATLSTGRQHPRHRSTVTQHLLWTTRLPSRLTPPQPCAPSTQRYVAICSGQIR